MISRNLPHCLEVRLSEIPESARRPTEIEDFQHKLSGRLVYPKVLQDLLPVLRHNTSAAVTSPWRSNKLKGGGQVVKNVANSIVLRKTIPKNSMKSIACIDTKNISTCDDISLISTLVEVKTNLATLVEILEQLLSNSPKKKCQEII